MQVERTIGTRAAIVQRFSPWLQFQRGISVSVARRESCAAVENLPDTQFPTKSEFHRQLFTSEPLKPETSQIFPIETSADTMRRD